MLAAYKGKQLNCTESPFDGSLYFNRAYLKPASQKRTRPQSLIFNPTYHGPGYRGQYHDVIVPHTATLSCNGNPVSKTGVKSGYDWFGGVLDVGPNLDYCPAIDSNKLLAKIKDEKVNLALLSAEYRKTASAFVQGANRLVRIVRAARRLKLPPNGGGGKRRPPDPKKDPGLHQDYLLVRYGLMPTVQDMQGALSVLKDGCERPPVKRFSTSKSNVVDFNYASPPWAAFPYTLNVNYSGKSKLTAYVEFDTTSIANQMNSLGLTNPLALAWELMPYSFVLDWFINIGDYLSAIDALNGTLRTAATLSHTQVSKCRYSYGGGGQYSMYYRKVTGLGPVAPRYKASTSKIHILDALALLKNLKH